MSSLDKLQRGDAYKYAGIAISDTGEPRQDAIGVKAVDRFRAEVARNQVLLAADTGRRVDIGGISSGIITVATTAVTRYTFSAGSNLREWDVELLTASDTTLLGVGVSINASTIVQDAQRLSINEANANNGARIRKRLQGRTQESISSLAFTTYFTTGSAEQLEGLINIVLREGGA